MIDFKVVGEITNVEIIAVNKSIRDLARLNRTHGKGRWRKLKGIANVELPSGRIRLAEVHWYEAHGIGKKEMKIKLPFLD
ncbi:MAG TPA: hypothetical protein VK892_09170 [Pyrinomonadaceae bacterium]|nr:hypothetical protein [Pyrinomonadaceae bacterium]